MVKWNWYHCVISVTVLGLVISESSKEQNESIIDFSCITYNWNEYVICTWNYSTNVLLNQLDVYWQPVIFRSTWWYHCPELTNTSCKWNIKDSELAIDIERQYTICIKLNEHKNFISVRWNESVQPAPVFNLDAIATNMSCVLVKWDHSDYVHNKTFRVNYTPLSGFDFTERIATIYSEDDKIQVKICDLKPNTKYEIKVSCKTVRKGIWSIAVSTTVITKKSRPSIPPSLYKGGYSWRRTNALNTQLTFFWKPINKSEWNGDSLTYDVQITDVVTQNTTVESGSQFSLKLEVSRNTSYQVLICSRNEVGNSRKQHSIFISSYKDLNFTEEILALKNQRYEIELFWKSANKEDIKFYSVFWCEQAFGDICKKTPSSVQVDAKLNKSTIPGLYKDDLSTYLFGVSYTTKHNVTSGFIWSDCYIDFTSQEFPFHLEVTLHPLHDGILVKWRFSKCKFVMDKQLISMYIVHICSEKECKDYTERNVTGTKNNTVLHISEKQVCVRVFPYWNGLKGKPSQTTCIDMFNGQDLLLPVLLIIGAVFAIFAVFGCCLITRKLGRVVKKAKQPFIIETPVIYNNNNLVLPGESGLPLLDT